MHLGDLLPKSESSNRTQGTRWALHRFSRHRWEVVERNAVPLPEHLHSPLLSTVGKPNTLVLPEYTSHMRAVREARKPKFLSPSASGGGGGGSFRNWNRSCWRATPRRFPRRLLHRAFTRLLLTRRLQKMKLFSRLTAQLIRRHGLPDDLIVKYSGKLLYNLLKSRSWKQFHRTRHRGIAEAHEGLKGIESLTFAKAASLLIRTKLTQMVEATLATISWH